MEAEIQKLTLELEKLDHISEKNRLWAVIKKLEGQSNFRIAVDLGYSEAWVKKWLSRYRKQGLIGIINPPKSGRPPLLTKDVLDLLKIKLEDKFTGKIAGKDILHVLESDFQVQCTLDYAYKLKSRLNQMVVAEMLAG